MLVIGKGNAIDLKCMTRTNKPSIIPVVLEIYCISRNFRGKKFSREDIFANLAQTHISQVFIFAIIQRELQTCIE